MGAEIVSLRLQQIGRQHLAAERIVVAQRGGERRGRDPQLGGGDDDLAPRRLRVLDDVLEVGIQQQVIQIRIGVEGVFDPFQEDSADNAAAAPQHRDRAVVERPSVLLGRRGDLDESLRVRADLRGVQRQANLLDEGLLIARPLGRRPA